MTNDTRTALRARRRRKRSWRPVIVDQCETTSDTILRSLLFSNYHRVDATSGCSSRSSDVIEWCAACFSLSYALLTFVHRTSFRCAHASVPYRFINHPSGRRLVFRGTAFINDRRPSIFHRLKHVSTFRTSLSTWNIRKH